MPAMQVRHHASQQELLISVLISVLMKNHSCSLISLVAGPKEERLQMVRPRLDQWHCAKPGAILEVPGFADVFQSLRHCAEVVFQQPLLFRFFRLIRSTFAQ